MIAEDDLLMADMLEDVLVENGYRVCGIARTVAEGVEIAELCKPDLAVLDVRLAGEDLGTDLAARLDHPGGPGVLYVTGNVGQINLGSACGEACLSKPYRPADILHALKIVQEIVSTGKPLKPFPRGFYLLEQPTQGAASVQSGNESTGSAPGDLLAEIRRLRRQQAALAGFGRFALGESDLDKVLTEAARVCAESLEVSFCKICRYRPEENDLLVAAGVGWHQGVIGCVVSRADESSPQGRAFTTGEPVICSDLRDDASYVLPVFYAEHGIVSTVDVVIRKEGQPYGVLEIDSPVQHDYDGHDIDFLTGFANVLAEAISTAKRNVALQSAVLRMEDMVSDRDRLLAAKNVVLIEKNALIDEKSALLAETGRLLDDKDVLAQELQHRVRNNLQLVYGMLNKHLQQALDGPGNEGVRAIARRVMTLAQVYDHLLGNGLSRTIDFGTYLSSLCSSIESLQTLERPDVTLTCHVQPIILDLDTVTALGLVVSELISNSYDHAFPDRAGTISVTLSHDKADDDATIIFADDGVGFTEAVDNKRHGLSLVKRLLQQVNGSATLRSEHGTEWTLRFPLHTSSGARRDKASSRQSPRS